MGDFQESRLFGMSPMGTMGMGRCRQFFYTIMFSMIAFGSVNGLGHFSDEDLNFFDLPKRGTTPRGSEVPRSSKTAHAALAPLIVSPRMSGASVMSVVPLNVFMIGKLIFRAGHLDLKAPDRGDDEQAWDPTL
jgi:hypothetical protein